MRDKLLPGFYEMLEQTAMEVLAPALLMEEKESRETQNQSQEETAAETETQSETAAETGTKSETETETQMETETQTKTQTETEILTEMGTWVRQRPPWKPFFRQEKPGVRLPPESLFYPGYKHGDG